MIFENSLFLEFKFFVPWCSQYLIFSCICECINKYLRLSGSSLTLEKHLVTFILMHEIHKWWLIWSLKKIIWQGKYFLPHWRFWHFQCIRITYVCLKWFCMNHLTEWMAYVLTVFQSFKIISLTLPIQKTVLLPSELWILIARNLSRLITYGMKVPRG